MWTKPCLREHEGVDQAKREHNYNPGLYMMISSETTAICLDDHCFGVNNDEEKEDKEHKEDNDEDDEGKGPSVTTPVL